MASDKDTIKLWRDRADELRRKCDEQYAELKRWRNWAAQYGDREVGVAENETTTGERETVDTSSRCIYGEAHVGGAGMTIDEAISHCDSLADSTPCGREHVQLAEWLRELKRWRNWAAQYGDRVAVSKTETTTPLLPKDGENVNKPTAVDTGVNNDWLNEISNYMSQGVDYFTVDCGPWHVKYDNTKGATDEQ